MQMNICDIDEVNLVLLNVIILVV